MKFFPVRESLVSNIPAAGGKNDNLIDFPSPAGMSLTNLPLAGNYEIFPGQGEFG
jgi:hypothetical protein